MTKLLYILLATFPLVAFAGNGSGVVKNVIMRPTTVVHPATVVLPGASRTLARAHTR